MKMSEYASTGLKNYFSTWRREGAA